MNDLNSLIATDCECESCLRNKEIRRLEAKLNEKDAESLSNLYNAMFDEAVEADMKIVWLEDQIEELKKSKRIVNKVENCPNCASGNITFTSTVDKCYFICRECGHEFGKRAHHFKC